MDHASDSIQDLSKTVVELAEVVERNTQEISKISTHRQEEVQSANRLSQEMVDLTENQLRLVERFDQTRNGSG